ncbi:MAG: universal stress protein [Furfurilactobacillus sp.]|jgi:nucleotide-binding universal stress UspA family protein|uniref:Universal stress protein n=1 Tax=Furfurilactobacillus milii TaxID=2888272 RepID=A0ABT6DB88_9LACO|nr:MULTISPECIES: universal stress protein [Furfurilactobacillus]QLE67391.1 Universal stress protein [Furfurilactobacillus rossiae]MCF6161528.1 universal stress protein [Furfurilactobacillus milii]MCF6163908.1 universal stress protein [Furfurilactobacillus milii]MCF6419447.1 universal stress protein [Furfurilactobacillus milii]MCH4011581.1 universal stress protein [Furfurilactobacillus sp.]
MLQQYKNILAPVDGSKATEPVLEKAIEVAKRNDTHLDILNVLEVNQFSDSYGGAVSGDVIYRLVEDVQNRLESLKQQAEKAGVKDVDIHVRFGNPKPVISREFPQDHGNELIVMGTTGLNAVERLMVGSVTNYVSRNADVDVLIVKVNQK